MRRWKCQCFLIGALALNIIILYYFWKLQSSLELVENRRDNVKTLWPSSTNDINWAVSKNISQSQYLEIVTVISQNPEAEIPKYLTIVIREFEFFENDLADSVYSFLKIFPTIKIIVLADAFPYPPLHIPFNVTNLKLVVLHPQVDEAPFMSRPEKHIDTPFVLFVPDSVRLSSVGQLEEMLTYIVTHPNNIAAAPIENEVSVCNNYKIDLKKWTLELKDVQGNMCDAVVGETVLMLRTAQIFQLTQPFARPFPQALFIQTTLRAIKVYRMDKVIFKRGRPLFLDTHLEWKHLSATKERMKMLYEDFGIKKVVTLTGEIEWYGCSKMTPRCFGTVVNDTPQYLYQKRWTPPCCLERLRETARHVFSVLGKAGVRYWLEGGSLLGAARSSDIIPWDYDVDVGIYEDDIKKCEYLRDSINQPVITENGFMWEKASEGDFFRVQYSQTNHLHVDIFPFYPKNGIMTKKKWTTSHHQDVDFPEHYLRPLTTLTFAGYEASAPNNIREFLELKFGEGVIDKYEYPNPKLIAFPSDSTT